MTSVVESPSTRALTVNGVGKQFGATHALRDVSFEVRRGQVHALVGHNGCGKSTLVKIISGYQSADTGSVVVAVTWCPCATSWGTSRRPITPVPPATKTRIVITFLSWSWSLLTWDETGRRRVT